MFEREFEEYDQEQVIELIEHYEQMVKDDARVFFEEGSFDQIIEYYQERQQLDKAFEVVEMAIAQHPFSALLLIKKAQLEFDQKRYEVAMETLDQAAVFDSTDMQIHLLRCDIFVWQGKFAEAIDTIHLALEFADEEERIDLFLELADIYEEWEKYDELFATLAETLRMNPDNEEALNRLWFCVEFTEKYQKSVDFHKAFIDEHPYAHLAWFNLAHAYAGLKQYDEAVEAFEFVMAIDETYEYAYKDCGEVLFKMENYTKAAEYLIRATAISKPYKELYYSIGECFEQMENFVRARSYYRKATNLDPYFADAYFKVGVTYEEEGRFQNALSAYERAYKLDEENAEFALALAVVYHEMGDLDNAVAYYKLGVELEPDNKDNWIELAKGYFESGEFREALSIMEKAILQFEDAANLYYIKSAFYYQIGNRHEAFINLERALLQDFASYAVMFEVTPYMEQDDTVISLINQYRK